MDSKSKILVVGLIVIVVGLVAGLLILRTRGPQKRIELKGKLEKIEAPSPLFNKECLNTDLRVGSYYLKGVCKEPYLAASLLDVIGQEIEITGYLEKVEMAVSSEENPEILIDKTFSVLTIEKIVPPEIVKIQTDTDKYRVGEKITIHLKHYLRENIFSHFGAENPACSIESIEKKNGNWEKVSDWFLPSVCSQIALAETKPFYLSGDFKIFEWQENLGPGQYRLKVVYKLAGEDDWKTIYSNEFIILKETEIEPSLNPAVIKGRITNYQGGAVARVLIDFCEKLTASVPSCGSGLTDEAGNYLLEFFSDDKTQLRPGVYDLYFYPDPSLNLKSEYREVILKEEETKVVDLGLGQAGSIRGKIVDNLGNPLTQALVYEIGFETPRYHVCELAQECELGTFVIPYLDPGDYEIGASVKIDQEYIEVATKKVKVELGKTSNLDFRLEK